MVCVKSVYEGISIQPVQSAEHPLVPCGIGDESTPWATSPERYDKSITKRFGLPPSPFVPCALEDAFYHDL